MMLDDDGELDYSNQVLLSNEDQIQSNCSLDDFLKDLLVDNHACTHTHTCNPPGPDSSHTHTCFHVHTQILPAPSDDKGTTDDTADSIDKKSKKRPVGNREAVRKYREKKKARANCLEDEVIRLKDHNQELMKRLQNQAVLEAEVMRLKCLLVDIRGRIEGEIGSFPYQKPTKIVDGMQNLSYPNLGGGGAIMVNPCDNVRCDDQVHCMHPGMMNKSNGEVGGFNGEEFGVCNVGYAQCNMMGNTTSSVYKELPGCGVANSVPALNYLAANKRKDHCQGMHLEPVSFHDVELNFFDEKKCKFIDRFAEFNSGGIQFHILKRTCSLCWKVLVDQMQVEGISVKVA